MIKTFFWGLFLVMSVRVTYDVFAGLATEIEAIKMLVIVSVMQTGIILWLAVSKAPADDSAAKEPT